MVAAAVRFARTDDTMRPRGTTPAGRQPASREAVLRRRAARQADRAIRAARKAARARPTAEQLAAARAAEEAERLRERQERFAHRRDDALCRRFVEWFVPLDRRDDPLFWDWRYWQLRKCGWDLRDPELRQSDSRAGARVSYLDLTLSPVWRWWCGLHHETRKMFVRESHHRGAGQDDTADGGGVGRAGVRRFSMLLALGEAEVQLRCAE
jgi:hypothetical protein